MTRTQPHRNRILTPLLALLLAAVAWLVWERHHDAAPAPVDRPSAQGKIGSRQVYFGPPNSIAVLPFRSTTEAPEDAVLAEAFAAEVLDLLVGVPAIQVAAASSSYFFRERQAELSVIAERLQSRHLLGGEWTLRSGQVELTLSLYDAHTDGEVWRTDMEAALPELLAGRSAICTQIVTALPVPPQECDRPLSTAEPAAWRHYAWALRHTDPSGEQDLPGAAAALQSALQIAPEFAAARLELAEVWLHPSWNPADGDGSVAAARAAVVAVLEAQPESARAWALISFIRHQHDWDWRGAADAGRRAAGLRPGDAGILSVASLALATVGEFETAHGYLEASLRRDPLNLHSALRLGLLEEFLGDYDAALTTYRKILLMNPDYPGGHAYRTRVKVLQEKPGPALRESEKEPNPFWRRYARILALSGGEGASPETEPDPGRRARDAEVLLEEMIEQHGSSAAFQIAELLAFRGDRERALMWLERAEAVRDPGMASLIGNRLLEGLHDDPRWAVLLERLSLPDGPAAGE